MASQAANAVILDAVIIKILHAHSFTRTSVQATSILSNILSRYLVLLASACGQFAELSGRQKPSVHDLVACLEEFGTNVHELSEYCSPEGIELSRYASSSAKRLDDLADIRGYLEDGLVHGDFALPLVYAPLPEDDVRLEDPDADAEEEDPVDEEMPPAWSIDQFAEPLIYREHSTLSYVPDFLPPFPDASRPHSPSPTPAPFPVKMERPPSPLPQHITSVTAGDYVTQVPYSDSVLSSTPSWHLPSQPPRTSNPQLPRSSAPSTQQALLAAYHHILTHPAPPTGPANPAKHKIAMALLTQVQNNTRWDTPPTLNANITPCQPRVVPIGPSYPVAQATLEDARLGKDTEKDLEKRSSLPPAPPRPVFSSDRPVYLASQQSSRLPELARQVLPGSVLTRTTRLTHPPLLQRGSQKLYYGSGIPAPWNSSLSLSTQGGKSGDDPGSVNGQEASSFSLPDAQMFTTWDFETKNYQEPLNAGRKGRVPSTPMVSLSLGRPSKA